MSEKQNPGVPQPSGAGDGGSFRRTDEAADRRAPARGTPARGTPARPAESPQPSQAPPPPKRTSAQIRADMDRQREELGKSVDHLRERVTEITDWRGQIKKHRKAIVVGAVATGFVVGGLMALHRR